MGSLILAIDQGTTSSRAIVFDADLRARGSGQQEFEQHFPASGWVEHEPEDLWRTVLATCEMAIADAGVGVDDIAAIGITNQRETTLVWNRHTGEPIHKAIVSICNCFLCSHSKVQLEVQHTTQMDQFLGVFCAEVI